MVGQEVSRRAEGGLYFPDSIVVASVGGVVVSLRRDSEYCIARMKHQFRNSKFVALFPALSRPFRAL